MAVPRIPYGRQPKKLPPVLSQAEVLELLECIPSRKIRTVLTTVYATAMRIDEALHLGVADIDSRPSLASWVTATYRGQVADGP